MIDPKLLASAGNVALALAKVVPLGGPAIAAGMAALDLLNGLRETASASDEKVAEFEAGREALERAVNARADATAASLE